MRSADGTISGVIHESGPLKEAAEREGFQLVGVCPASAPPHFGAYLEWLAAGNHAEMGYMESSVTARSHSNELLPGAKSILAVGLNYNSQPPPDAEARVARYALGRDYHKVLKGKLKRIAKWAEDSYPGLKTRPCVDSAPVLERDYAQLAGLGWFGKNTCLINSKTGSWFFIGLLILDQEFTADSPAVGSCGSCRLCLDACPTGALTVRGGVPTLESGKCISYLTIEHRGDFTEAQQQMLNGWVFGCDVCQEVCPFNQPRTTQPLRAAQTSEPDFSARPNNALPRLEELSSISDEEFHRRYAGTPLMRAGAKGLRRNARALLAERNRKA
jgi:epoxyqueuosine reductase